MAPKKQKKDDGPSEAELQKQREEEERKKKEAEEEARKKAEEEARHREEEERRRREEEERRREDEIRRAKEEEERRVREKEREIQQIQLLEEKDKEINDLKEKVYALNRSFASIQNDLEAETRRSSQLTNDLDVTHMKLIEVEGSQEKKEKDWAAAHEQLKQENVQLQHDLESKKEAFNHLQAENEHLKSRLSDETENLRTEVDHIRSDKDKDDTENTILMKLLHTELDKYKQQTQQMEAELERKERDDVKNTIMLGLLNSQLDSGKEENRRLNDMIDEYRRRVDALETKLEAANAKLGEQSHAYDELAKESSTQKENLLREIDVHKTKVEQLNAQINRLNEECDSTKTHFVNHQAEAERKDKEAFERNVILKADLEHTKKQLAMLQEEAKKAEDNSFTRNTQQVAEIDSLKIRLQRQQEAADKAEKAAFESITVLKADVETHRNKIQTLTESQKDSDKEHFEKLTATRTELEAERTAHSQTKHTAEQKEKNFFEQITRMTAEQDSLQRQVVQLQSLNEKRDKEYVENTVFLNAEKEQVKIQLQNLTERIAKKDQEHNEYVAKTTQEMQAMQRSNDGRESTLQADLAAEGEKLIQERQQTEALQKRVQSLETEVAKKDKDSWDKSNAYKTEIQSLRNELEGSKQTIEKLEGSIAENFNFKILAEQNEMLKAELQSYKNQVANLNNTVATMKIEADILDNYKTKVLQEQNELYVRRIQQLEKEQRTVVPIVNEMVSTLQRHGLTTSLQADIDQYRAMVARSQAASPMVNAGNVNASAVDQSKSASAMGRKELSPLNQVH